MNQNVNMNEEKAADGCLDGLGLELLSELFSSGGGGRPAFSCQKVHPV